MNHVYRLKRSGRTQQLQPVPETARAAGKGSRTGKTLAQTVTAALASVALGGMASLAHAQQAPPVNNPPAVNQLPQGGVVTRGNANIVSSTSGNTALMSVNQNSQRAVIDWSSFNVGSQAKVQFNQPSANAVVLNNILGNNASQIYGQISANGQVFLSNPNGVYFSPTAQVNVGGLVATTGRANADEFMAGKASFNRSGSTGSVVNEGQLTSAAGGYIALLAPEVRNQGVVIAQAGTVALASGEAITLNFNNLGTGLAGITTTPQAIAALVENRSAVLAEGGQIILSAHALATLQGGLINNSGTLQANSMTTRGGKILLESSQAIVQTGTLDASGTAGGAVHVSTSNLIDAGSTRANGQTQGGDIRMEVTGRLMQTTAAQLQADATAGPGGQIRLAAGESAWLSGHQSANGALGGDISVTAPLLTLAQAALQATGETGGGRIRVGGGWQGLDADVANAQTTRVMASTMDVSATRQGQGGTAVVWSENQTMLDGSIAARGGAQGGNGGQVEVSSHGQLTYAGQVDATAPLGQKGRLLLDPKNITIVASLSSSGYSLLSLPDPHPDTNTGTDSGFGTATVELLNNGVAMNRIAVSDPLDSTVASKSGAVFLYNSTTGALISTLTGGAAGDQVGKAGVVALRNTGNLLVLSSLWGGAKGAATWVNGLTGTSAVVSAANSLVGSTAGDGTTTGDGVGLTTARVMQLTNGHYVVRNPNWAGGKGAATWSNADGSTVGEVSSSNSLVGTLSTDTVASGSAIALTNGNYVIASSNWSGGATNGLGAVTWGNGSTGIVGEISASNSLVGSTTADRVGNGLTGLKNGNYVAMSGQWRSNRGAVTWGNGTLGTVGVVSSSNSIVGSVTNDRIGSSNYVLALDNGNYVFGSSSWSSDKGAVTWGNGNGGTVGEISSLNSLVGSTNSENIGSGASLQIRQVANSNYVVGSENWGLGKGAVTWGNGSTGTFGVVSASNSLVGSTTYDKIKLFGTLTNGNYLAGSSSWGASATANSGLGAVAWGDGSTGTVGVVSAANALVGSTAGDRIGGGFNPLAALTNGNYVVLSPYWSGGTSGYTLGAVTWGNGAGGTVGAVSSANSLVGTGRYDSVGQNFLRLTNGNYVVRTSAWGATAATGTTGLGAVTWGNGLGGTVGAVSSSNSLVGSVAGDQVGSTQGSTGLSALANGNYVVTSPMSNNVGAVTWGNGLGGTTGLVSSSNSLMGSTTGTVTTGDQVGSYGNGVMALPNGSYVVQSPSWSGGGTNGKGAITWAKADGSTTGLVSPDNSFVGSAVGDRLGANQTTTVLSDGRLLIRYANWTDGAYTRTGRVDIMSDGAGTGSGASLPLSYSVDAGSSSHLLASTLLTGLNAGTSVTLQANNDITVSTAIVASNPGGTAGDLSLQAGRSVLLNASITTGNGNLNLVANDRAANGVVDAYRDAGAATITMASGVSVNAGTGQVSMVLRDGAGNTNSTNGNITLGSITASSISVANEGTSVGSISLGALNATDGVTVTNANGGITVGGNIAAGSAALLLQATGDISQNASTAVSTTGGNITYWADSDADAVGSITLTAGTSAAKTTVSAGAGNVVFGGGNGATAADGAATGVKGIALGSYASLSGGNITLVGKGSASTVGTLLTGTFGVELADNVSVVGTGAVAITGTGGGGSAASASSSNIGVQIGASTVESTGGTVTITGTGGGVGAASLNNFGVYFSGQRATSSTVRTVAGDLTIQGVEGAGTTTTGYNRNSGIYLYGYAQLGGTSQSGALKLLANDILWPMMTSATLQTTGAVTIAPISTSFVTEQRMGTNVVLAGTPDSLTIGKVGNTAALNLLTPMSVAGPISLLGGPISINANLTSTGLISLKSYGGTAGIQQGLPGLGTPWGILSAPLVSVTAANNAVVLGNDNAIGTVAVTGATNVRVVNAGALTIGTAGSVSGISASGTIVAITNTGDLTIAGNIATTSTSPYVMNIEAGFSASPGDSTGGNILLTNSSTLTTGLNATARLYTGSLSGSTVLAAYVGAGSGRFRYGSDGTTSNFTQVVTSGLNLIYREKPTVSWSTEADQSIVYGQSMTYSTTGSLNTYSTTNSFALGLQNGDEAKVSQALLVRTSVAPKTTAKLNSSNVYDAGVYEVSKTAAAEALGYAATNPKITVTKAPLTITAKDATKVYDGGAYSLGNGLNYSGFVASETTSVLGGSAVYGGAAQGAINAGSYALTVAGLTAKNYSITYNPGTLTVSPKPLTIRVNDDARFVGQSDTAGYAGASYTGFVTGESISTLGSLSITRTATSAAGTHVGALQASIPGLTNTNYNITYTPGNYTIVPADQLLIKLNNVATTYGTEPVYAITSAQYLKSGTNVVIDLTSRASITGTSFSLTDGDGGSTSFTVGAQSASLSTAGQLNAYGGYQLGANSVNNSSTNYNNTITTTGALTVNPKTVSATAATGLTKTYDGNANMPSLSLALSGTLSGDNLSVTGQGAYASANAGTTHYDVKNLVLSGVDHGNYVLTAGNSISGTNGTINKAALTVTAQGDRKIFDGEVYVGGKGVAYSGLVNNEDSAVLGGALSYTGTSQNAVNAGSYTITPQGLSSSNYTITYVDAPLTIDPATITTSSVNAMLQGPITKVYDGNDTAILTSANYILTGWVGTDTADVTKVTGTYDNPNVGNGKLVIVNNLITGDYQAGSGTNLANYVLPTSISGAVGSITPKPVTVSGLTAANKTYDGNASVLISNWGSVSTGVANESLTLLSGTAAFADANAQNNKTVTASGYSLADGTGGLASNYVLSSAVSTTLANIDAKVVTVSATARTTTYDAVSTYSDLANNTGFVTSGLMPDHWVSSVSKSLGGSGVSPTGLAQAGNYTVSPSSAVLGSGSASNYIFNYAAATNTVDKANLAVTATPSLSGNVYRGTAYTGSYTSTALGNDANAITVTGVATGTNAGTYTSSLAVSGAVLSNYNTPVITNADLVISPKPVTVTNTARSTTYDGTISYATLASGTQFTTSALVGSDAVGSVTQTANGVTSTGVAQAGSFSVTPSAAVLGTGTVSNYSFSYMDGTHTVDKANATVIANSGTLTYNGGHQTVSGFTASGLVGGETASVLRGVTASRTEKNAGTYATTASGTDGNYNLAFVDGSMVINKAAITATGNSASVIYNGANQTVNGFTLSGLQGSDTVGSLISVLASGATAQNAGSYTNTVTAGVETNYTVTPVNGSLTIARAALTATGNSAQVTYKGANQSVNGFTVSGLMGNDTEAGLTGISASGVTGFNVGSYANTMTVVDQPNYSVTGVNGSLLISAAPITAIQGALQGSVSKVYDSTTAATLSSSHYLLTGWLGSDMATVTKTTGTFDDANAGSGKTVTVRLNRSDYQANGSTNLSNYDLPDKIQGAVGQITKASVIPAITVSDKVYDTTTVANGAVSLSGVYSADALAASAVAAGYSFSNPNVGTGKTVTASGITLGAGLMDNYVLTSNTATGTASITPAPLTVTAKNAAKFVTQNDTANFLGYAVTGLLGSETPASAGITAGVSLSRSNDSVHLADVYPGVLVPSGAAVIGNYAVRYVPGTFTIVPAGQLLVETISTNTTYGTSSFNPIASVTYLDGSNNTINPLTLGSQAVVNGATVFTYNDGASGTASFSIAPTGTTTSASGQLRVGSYGLVAGHFSKTTGNLQSNTATVTGNLTVQPLAITVAATPSTTTYNSTTQAQAQSSGVLGGDAVTVSGAVRQRNAGSYTSALSATGADVGNYSITYGNSNFTINPAALTTSASAADKVYDGSTSASLTLTDNRFVGDAVSVTARGQFADKNVGVNKSVAITGLNLSGADASNYSLNAPASTTAAITRLAQVTWVGGTTGSWFDPANWAGGAVPDLANVANVTIPAGVTVSFDHVAVSPAQAGAVNVDSLGTAGSLALSAGSLNVGSGGVALNTLTQTGGSLVTTGALALGSLSQSAGSLSADSLSTTAYNQSGTGTIAVTGNVAKAASAAPVVLGNLSTGGSLNVSSTGGSISQAAGTLLNVAGPATLTASQGGAAADVTLDNAGNALNGPVTATGADVKLRTTGALATSVTATGNATLTSGGSTTLGATMVGGDLRVTTANADVTQTGPLVVGGTTTLDAGTGSVQLTDAGNRLVGTVKVTSTSSAIVGAVSSARDQAPAVLTPKVGQAKLPYQVTLVQLPQKGEAGQVHVELQNAAADAQIALPVALQNWIADLSGKIW
jgi:trimeric autotransporter adhesin